MSRSDDTSRVAMPRAPDVRYCRLGHVKDYAVPSGALRCRVCAREWHQRRYEPKRQARLEARRRRIAGRASPPEADCIWAAGHFEGEGTVTIVSCGPKRAARPHVCLTSTDESMPAFFQARWPGRVRRFTPNSVNGRAREAFRWNLDGTERIEGFLLDILPHVVSTRVREKAELVIEDIRERVQQRRTPEARARMAARHLKMREMNRRGVEVDEG